MKINNISKETATRVALWWFNQIDKPHENGERDQDFIFAIFDSRLDKPEITSKQKDIFIETLVFDIMNRDKNCFGCDYAPDDIFFNALEKSHINPSRLPWKTYCVIDGEKITVRNGYGSSWVEI